MALSKTLLIARILWIFPVILVFLTINQANVAFDLQETLSKGEPAIARVTDYFSSDRVDVSYDYISLRVALADGEIVEKEKLSLPHSFAAEIEGKVELPVRVLRGADQEIVIESVGRAHWRIAAINSVMSLIALVLASVGVFYWNRYLKRKGDPALQPVEEPSDPVI